jgi:hypothetical protein
MAAFRTKMTIYHLLSYATLLNQAKIARVAFAFAVGCFGCIHSRKGRKEWNGMEWRKEAGV